MQSKVTNEPESPAVGLNACHPGDHLGITLTQHRLEIIGAWCGPVCVLLVAIALLMSGFLPILSPMMTAEQVKLHYIEHLAGIRFGMILYGTGFTLLGVWGLTIAMYTRRVEQGLPYLSWIQITMVAGGVCAGVLEANIWAVASFRPDEILPETTRMLNDLGWFIFLFYWQPFAVWVISIGITILMDRSEKPVFPRWVAYFCFWAAVIFVPAGLIVFFKEGPFAYNGLLACYLPAGVFFSWCLVLSLIQIRVLNRRRVE